VVSFFGRWPPLTPLMILWINLVTNGLPALALGVDPPDPHLMKEAPRDANEGLLVRRQGSGTFVVARVEKNFSKLTSFSEDMRARGRTPRSVWLQRSEGTVSPEEAIALRSSPGTPVYRFHRIRFANDAPMSIEYATVLASSLPSLDSVESSLYEALEKAGNRPVRALQRLRAVLLTGEQARLLQAKDKDAGLLVERLGFLKDGRAAEFSQSYYRGDTYDFVAELSSSS